ncbi:MAG: tyrosine-type recombinase/integrase [Sedimentisphaerales bacterium]|nr:tyrosine-type recombinase/integrase [Sedimentisphaerales bacterium]
MGKKGKYIEPKRTRIGRNLFVCGFDGHPIRGLSWDKGNGTYYYTFFGSEKDFKSGIKTRKDYSFGSEYQSAVFAYKSWAKGNSNFILNIPDSDAELKQTITKKLTPKEQQGLQRIYKDLGSDKVASSEITFGGEGWQETEGYTIKSKLTTNKGDALYLLKQLLQDEEFRIEAIRILKLDDLLPKEYKTLPIKEVLEFYQNTNDCSTKEKRKVKTAVEHFISIIHKKNINDIIEDDLKLYKDIILKSKYSDTYKKGKLNRVKTALSYYVENKNTTAEKELVRNVLTLCREILKTSTAKPDDKPKSIDSQMVQKIFHQANNDDELLLMFLLMLNTGFTPIDIRTLKKSMLRNMNGITYLVHRRTKTDGLYIRVNCLWDVTAKLLKKQFDKYPKTEFVFITQAGGKYTESTLDKKFSPFFRTLNNNYNTSYTAKHFKDTVASNIAFDVNDNVIKVTLGHSIIGVRDSFWKYAEVRPEQQKPAIDILYKKFQNTIEGIKI